MLFIIILTIKRKIDAIATMPEARPSIPSMKLIAFMNKIIQKIVITYEKYPNLIVNKLKNVN